MTTETENVPAVTLEIDAKQAPSIYTGNGLNKYLDHIKSMVNEVPDTTTKKGRERIASLAYKVSQSKTAVEKPGREYLKVIKELPKKIEAELKEFVDECDKLRDAIRQPLTDLEAEQARLEAERKAAEEAAALAKQVEADHELALLMDREWEREREEKRQAAIRAQQEREAEIARQAAEHAAAAERQRQENERLAAEAEQRRREADVAHRGAINQEALADLIKAGLTEEQAKLAITAIAKANVRHITINY